MQELDGDTDGREVSVAEHYGEGYEVVVTGDGVVAPAPEQYPADRLLYEPGDRIPTGELPVARLLDASHNLSLVRPNGYRHLGASREPIHRQTGHGGFDPTEYTASADNDADGDDAADAESGEQGERDRDADGTFAPTEGEAD